MGHARDMRGVSIDEMREHSWSVLDAAWEEGVRYFDVARSYGRSEEFLAGWLHSRSIGPYDVAVGSKWGYRYTAGWAIDTGGSPHEVKDHSVQHFLSQVKETEELLGTYIRLYQIHSATLESGVLRDPEVAEELGKLRKRRNWRIGLSVSGEKQAEVIRLAMQCRTQSGEKLFDCVQATWNIQEQSAGEALLEAKEAGMDVIIKEAMANGRLLAGTDAAVEALSEASALLNTTPDAMALAVALVQPFSPMVLSGGASVNHVRSNMKAHALVDRLKSESSQKILRTLLEKSKVEPNTYWTTRSQLAWN